MEQYSEAWLQARIGRITASAVGAILGNSPWMTRADVMRAMVRDREGAEREFTGNPATEWGTFNEAGARAEYEMETLHEVQEYGFIEYEDWAGMSPDGLIGDKGLLEIKCPFSKKIKPLDEQPHYVDQVQFQLFISGRKWCHFYTWTPDGTKLETVLPDPDWVNDNIPRLRQFHAEFLAEPADDHLAPKRVIVDTTQAYKMITEYDELTDQIERATQRKKELLADIVAACGDHDAEFAGRKLTQVRKDGSISYAKAIKELLPNADLEKWRGAPSSYWLLNG